VTNAEPTVSWIGAGRTLRRVQKPVAQPCELWTGSPDWVVCSPELRGALQAVVEKVVMNRGLGQM
jgi:hypothetical protein